MDVIFFVFCVLPSISARIGNCPTQCKSEQICTASDNGCSECNREYYGRQCQHRTECRYTDEGTEYRGLRNTTYTGKTCEFWKLGTHHIHYYHSPEGNYCRNPDTFSGLWCYTTDKDTRWEECDVPKCDTQCPPLKFEFAGVEITNPPLDGFKPGFIAKINVECMTGFEVPSSENPATTKCQNDLTWSNITLPTCKKIRCHSPALNAHSRIYSPMTVFEYEGVITIMCDTGYTMQGKNQLTCQSDRTWSPSSPSCHVNECPGPASVPNSSMTGKKDKYIYQDTVTITCDTGYTIHGTADVKCQADKTWSSRPTCEVNKCPEPAIANGKISTSQAVYKYQDTIAVDCNLGYTLQGPRNSNCLANKTWSKLPICKIDECPEPSITDGRILYTQVIYKYQDMILNKCPEPAIANGKISTSQAVYKYQDTIAVDCNLGYTLQGPRNSNCLANKTWSKLPICKIDECPEPSITDGRILYTQAIYKYQDMITVACNLGYTLQEPLNSKCLANKTWSTPLICKINECLSPNLKANSKINRSIRKSVYQYKAKVTIICDAGYIALGSQTLTCQANKTWDVESPACKKVKCAGLVLTSNLIISNETKRGFYFKDLVTFTCKKGYRLSHSNSLECQSNKSWDKEMPNCKEKSSSTGAVVGGVVGTSFVVISVVIVFVFVWRRIKNSSSATSSATSEPMEFRNIENSMVNNKEPSTDNTYLNIRESAIASGSKFSASNANEHIYYNFEAANEREKIKTENLREYIRMKKGDVHFFDKEFKTFPVGLQRHTDAALKPKNRPKNKYKNIYPYDDNRITLKPQPRVPDSNFINASPIKGYGGKVKYIAAQGPQENTYTDFWRMVLEQNVQTIVMLTNPVENGVNKCKQYWPDEEEKLTAGGITVDLQSSDKFADFVVRRLKLTKERKITFVHQYHFTAWPDKDVPKNPCVLARFHKKVFDMPGSGPILVHCSAGVGRTGTFIALDYLLDEAANTGSVGIREALETLRDQRVNLVQTKVQYVFLHDVLAEAIELRSSIITAAEFPEKYRRLLTRNKTTGESLLQQEYESLAKLTVCLDEDEFTAGKREENKIKNRYKNILPTDANCVFLSGSGEDVSYINAVFLPGYRDCHAYIVTQTPLWNTMADFWKLVFEEKITCVVMLNRISIAEDVYWPEDVDSPLQYGDITVRLSSREAENDFRTLVFELYRDQEKHVVRQYQATFWSDTDPVPATTSPVLQLIDTVQRWQQQNEAGPILVHCANGADKSGLLCCIMVILDCLKDEENVFIQPVIKQMRSIRPQIVPSVEQLRYCYDCVAAYVDSFKTYSNFM